MNDEQQGNELDQGNDQGNELDQGNDQGNELDQGNDQGNDEQQGNELDQGNDDGESFGRAYVNELRKESQTYRRRANDSEKRADDLARALYVERVRALGILADPTDLPFDPDRLDDPAALETAARELVERKPHLRTRRVPPGGIGQGQQGSELSTSLAAILRANA